MNRRELIDCLEACAEPVRAEGATALFIYGSRARGDHRDNSDLDVFVDHTPDSEFSLLSLAGIYNILVEHTGLPISVTTRDSLHPKLKAEIERQALRIF
jgi:uncharacterized protein